MLSKLLIVAYSASDVVRADFLSVCNIMWHVNIMRIEDTMHLEDKLNKHAYQEAYQQFGASLYKPHLGQIDTGTCRYDGAVCSLSDSMSRPLGF